MQVTRRFWAAVALGVGFASLAVLLQRPLLLAAAALVGAWLLARQLLFTRDIARLDDTLVVDQTATPARVATDDSIGVTLSLALPATTGLSVTARAAPPVSARGSTAADRTVTLAPEDRRVTGSFEVTFPVAGSFTLEQPTVETRDPAGLYTESLGRGESVSVTVDPRVPRNVRVGERGEGVAIGYGDHEVGKFGTAGLDPEGLREYTIGDAARRIDWKATARLGRPQVREFRAETDLVTMLLVDHRATTGLGLEGERPLDFLREVALAITAAAHRLNDPVGCYTVGDEGITSRIDVSAAQGTAERIRRELRLLEPTPGERDAPSSSFGPAAARRATARLPEDRFGEVLRPYFAANDRYVRRVEANPLFAATREALEGHHGSIRTFLFTDDTDRVGVRETVKFASRGDDRVVVALAPRALYQPDGLADLETAYERYLAFEDFRRELARLDGVTALEVVPGDRIDAVLSDRRTRRTREGVTTRG
ncbi:DUF58 domain-containing protein [Halomarina litorea]|uniref:DUF58 domain-containing protein n=1 Tax=Halomarina litorea TaxID=2961595 RepID=UPI0020C574F8|nr:DUF58 domain-containing protein [Halomarina sp. BCD28]